METLTVRKLRQLLFEIKNQEANVVMFTEGNRECLPLVSIGIDESEDHGIVSLGFLKEPEEIKEARGISEAQQRLLDKIHPGAVCSECGNNMTEGEYSSGRSNCCKADVCGEEDF